MGGRSRPQAPVILTIKVILQRRFKDRGNPPPSLFLIYFLFVCVNFIYKILVNSITSTWSTYNVYNMYFIIYSKYKNIGCIYGKGFKHSPDPENYIALSGSEIPGSPSAYIGVFCVLKSHRKILILFRNVITLFKLFKDRAFPLNQMRLQISLYKSYT